MQIWYMNYDVCITINQCGGQTLRPCTNNFEGPNLDDLIAVPTPVPTPPRGVMDRRCRESEW